jgi:hypothetical protein
MHEFLEGEMLTTVQELQNLYDSLALARRPERKRAWGRRSSARASAAEQRESTGEQTSLSQQQRNSIVFVCIEDVGLAAHLACELGSMLMALQNLEVIILKSVGLSSVQQVRGSPRLLFLDMSGNHLCALGEVLRLVRECDNLLWADFEGNPLLGEGEAEEQVLAASSWRLRHLNKQPIEIRRKVAAIMTHGDAAARSTLCYQVWDAQVCSSPGVAGDRHFEPCRLERLALPAAGLSVFHVSPFSSLSLLDLSVCRLCPRCVIATSVLLLVFSVVGW